MPLLNLIFFPLLLPGALWDWTFKNLKNGDPTFLASIKKRFEVHIHNPTHKEEPVTCELSKEWREIQRPKMILQNTEKRLQTTWVDRKVALEKQTCLRQLVSQETLSEIVLNLKEGRNFNTILMQNSKKIETRPENFNPKINGYTHPANGFAEQHKTWISIFNKNRNLLSKTNSKDTTTLRMVRNAFSLV